MIYLGCRTLSWREIKQLTILKLYRLAYEGRAQCLDRAIIVSTVN